MADTQEGAGQKGPTAPYPAFQSLKTLAKQMKEHGIPSRIDRSVLTNFSGAVGGQVITMLKFMGLTDGDSHPTRDMQGLVNAYDTDSWAPTLATIVRRSYAPLFQINLETASPNQFNEHFRRSYPAADEVSRKSMTFFLNAVRDAGIKISPYIMKNKKPRSNPTKRRSTKQTSGRTAENAQTTVTNPPGGPTLHEIKKPSEVLLGLLDPANMKKEEQDAVWTLLKFFRAQGQ